MCSLMEKFIPLGAQQEDEEAEASQPLEEKVSDLDVHDQ